MPPSLIRYLLGFLLLLAATFAQAQLIDDVEVLRERSDAVVRIKFVTQVQFVRAIAAPEGQIGQILFQVLARDYSTRIDNIGRRVRVGELVNVDIRDESVQGDLTRKLVVSFDKVVRFTVRVGPGQRAIDIVIAGAGDAADANRRFIVRLSSSFAAGISMDVPIPSQFQEKDIFTTRGTRDGRVTTELNLGYFTSAAEAEQARTVLSRRFPQAQVIDLKPAVAAAPAPSPEAAPVPQAAAPSLPVPAAPVPAVPPLATTPLPGPATGAQPPVATTPAAPTPTEAPTTLATPQATLETEAIAKDLLAKGKAAIDAKSYETAIDTLNQLLRLPPNGSSQDAQELIGVARARFGDVNKAKSEFDLYLKLYPTGAGADRVRKEIAALAAGPEKTAAPRPRGPVETITSSSGSFSQFYYGGRSEVTTLLLDTPLQGTPQAPSAQTLSNVDQSRLISTLDYNWRRRSQDSDMRFVFRDSYAKNFLDTTTASFQKPNRLNALYFDYRQLGDGVSTRLGRQTPTAANGAVGKFDGAVLGYQFNPTFKLNAVGGVPSDKLFDTKQSFYGLSLDVQNLGRVSSSQYIIQSTIDGEVDRRAVGADLRYFDPTKSLYTLVDYDILFKAVTIATVQGSWQLFDGGSFNILADRRTTPLLSTANALIITATPSLGQLLETRSIDEIRRLSKATTTYANQGLVGVTVAVSERWQFGTDVSLTNVGALPAYLDIPAQPGTGNVVNVSIQTIGNKLYSTQDANVFGVSYLTAPTYNGTQFLLSNLSVVSTGLQLQPSFKYYVQSDSSGSRIRRFTPGLRISYRITPFISVETEFTQERQKLTGTTVNEDSTRSYYYAGYRVDF